MKNKTVRIEDLGLKDYKDTWDYQEVLFKQILDVKIQNRRQNTDLSTDNHFLFVEHPHVYTLGKSGDMSNLLLDEEQLKSKNAKFYKRQYNCFGLRKWSSTIRTFVF